MDSQTQTDNLYTQLKQLKQIAEQLNITNNIYEEEEEEEEFEETVWDLAFDSGLSQWKSSVCSTKSEKLLKQEEYELCFSHLDDIKIKEEVQEPDRMVYVKILREYEELKDQNLQYYQHIVQLNEMLSENLYKYNNSGIMEYEDAYSRQLMIQRRNFKIRKALLETLIQQYLES